MDKWERVNRLEKAQMEIKSAIRNIRLAIKDTNNERYCESYIIGHLDNWATGEHSIDTTIPKLIDEINELDEMEDESEEEE